MLLLPLDSGASRSAPHGMAVISPCPLQRQPCCAIFSCWGTAQAAVTSSSSKGSYYSCRTLLCQSKLTPRQGTLLAEQQIHLEFKEHFTSAKPALLPVVFCCWFRSRPQLCSFLSSAAFSAWSCLLLDVFCRG